MLLGRGARHWDEPVGVAGRPVRPRPFLHAMGHRIDDRGVEGLVALDRPAQLPEDRLGEVLALGSLVEHVLAEDVGAGVLEVILGLRNPMAGDFRDGGRSGGHGSPVDASVTDAGRMGYARLMDDGRSGPAELLLCVGGRNRVHAERPTTGFSGFWRRSTGPGCGSVPTRLPICGSFTRTCVPGIPVPKSGSLMRFAIITLDPPQFRDDPRKGPCAT